MTSTASFLEDSTTMLSFYSKESAPVALSEPGVYHIDDAKTFTRVRPLLEPLLNACEPWLVDDFTEGLDEHDRPVDALMENLATTVPNLWVAVAMVDNIPQVVSASSLTDIVPGREAFLHGISDMSLRHNRSCPLFRSLVVQTALAAMETAFSHYGVYKIKAMFRANNPGATGFCWQFGFKREAYFRHDTRCHGVLQDVVVYSLSCPTYFQSTRRNLSYVLRQ